MFLQIIAGIVTILTVSELYKRANLFISVGQITLIYIISYFAFFVIHEGSILELKFETFGLFVLCGCFGRQKGQTGVHRGARIWRQLASQSSTPNRGE